MKKNKMMRVASALLVAVLMTTSVISGTFAKYITTDSVTDSARVAKWGVVIQADGKLYGTRYDTTHLPVSTESNITVHVDASGDNIVAPGTKSDKGLTFSINGTPEVKTKLSVTIKSQNIYLDEGTYAVMVEAPTVTATSYIQAEHYIKNASNEYVLDDVFDSSETYYTKESEVTVIGNAYYPVIYQADLTDGTITEDSLNRIAADYAEKLNGNEAVVPAVSNCISTYTFTKEYAPNFDYSDLNVEGDTLKWAWAFEQTGDEATKKMYNGADTILANLMADTADDNYVVVKESTTAGTYDVITVTDELAKVGETTVACLKTMFSIDIRVEQLD